MNSSMQPKLNLLSRFLGFEQIQEETLALSDVKRQYEMPPAFINHLPFVNFNPDTETVDMSDGISVGAVIEVIPVDAEARPDKMVEGFLDDIENAFSTVPERDTNPWVIQTFLSSEPIESLYSEVKGYLNTKSPTDNKIRDHYLEILKEHLTVIGRQGGVFLDTKAGVPWSGKYRRARVVIYRQFNQRNWPNKNGKMPADELNRVTKLISSGLLEAGLKSFRYHASDIHSWLFPWFNPDPKGFNGPYDYLSKCQPDPEFMEWDYDIPVGLIQETPLNENNNWYFNEKPHRYIPIVHFNQQPRAGALTLEKGGLEKGELSTNAASLFDRLPFGSVFTSTIVFTPQDIVKSHLNVISERSTGKNAAANNAARDTKDCLDAMEHHKMYPSSMGVYLRADNDNEMDENVDTVFSILNTEKLQVVHPDHDLMIYNSYLNHLPFGYRPEYDSFLKRAKLQFLRNILAVSPFFGQGRGTEHPCFLFFNRSGQPIKIDLLNKQDREMSAHMLMFGPTGAGKSATTNYLLMQAMATYKPHLYVIDVGDSFRLLGDYFASRGLSVKYIRLDQANTPVPPFASSTRMLKEQEFYGLSESERAKKIEEQKEDKDKRDFMSEMESAAKLMITGGDQKEIDEFRRFDIAIVRAAIKRAAIKAYEEERPHALVDDFVNAFDAFICDEIPPGYKTPVSPDYKKRLEEMRDSARLFCDGIRGLLFNQYGDPLDQADVTIIDLGRIAMDDDKRDIMNLAFIGAMNTIQSDAEKRRGQGRQSIVAIDEAHVTTANPLTANYLAKGAKMWRKWGLWLWMLTQNLADFPDTSEKILNMAEFWLCLRMPKKEIEEISRFKTLSDEDKSLLSKARKESGKYAEGVILSEKHRPILFRNVPPALPLALAQTEEEEVENRLNVMKEFGLKTELEGCYKIAEIINEGRVKGL